MEPMTAIAADFLQRRLEGVRVQAFNKPKEALAWLATAPRVDLVLSDNHMAEMDGLAFLEQARVLAPHAPRALMTAYLDIVATPPQMGARGIHALLRKPWEWNDFGRAVFEILAMPPEEKARAEREGPYAYPEGAFAEFAASRRQAARPQPQPQPEPQPRPRPQPTTVPVVRHAPAQPAEPRDLATLLRRATASDEEDALRLLAYLQAHPGVAARLRAMVARPRSGP
jgi:CheY-like chemotaxis protein